jgi:hypothetical protein
MQTDRRQIMSFIDDVKKELAPQKPLPGAPDMNACSAAAQRFVNVPAAFVRSPLDIPGSKK